MADRAGELRQATGLGHRSRVGAVAAAWDSLAALMRERGAATVAELDPETVAERAESLWIRPSRRQPAPLSGGYCASWTERMLPAGSLNQAIVGPPSPREMPFSSWSKPS